MSDADRQDAVTAAESWLALLDARDFEGSWEEAAALFRAAVSPQQWEDSVESAYGGVGRPKSRTLDTAEYKTELPGAPDGEYFVLTYKTQFERKQSGVETVVPMRDTDGTWRISGYFVR